MDSKIYRRKVIYEKDIISFIVYSCRSNAPLEQRIFCIPCG